MSADSSVRPTPVRYQPLFEALEKDESETQVQLNDTLRKIQEITYKDGGHALRSVHAKSHALLRGQLQVAGNLAPELAQGLFAHAATYPLVMRLSTTPGDILDDSVSTPRAMALKIVGVSGARLAGAEDATTQDFVLINGPSFAKKDGKSFAGSLKLLAATTDKAPGLKKALSAVLQGAETLVESVGGSSSTLVSLGGHRETNPLGEIYYSATPFLYGPYMAKFSVAPVSPELTALSKKHVDLHGKPNGLRDAMLVHFAEQGGAWELRVQLCTDLEAMPIENAQTVWPEDKSPYVAVARVVVSPQVAWSEARSKAIDDGFAFSPWHGLAAHRPLGSVNRLRKRAYEMSRQFRAQRNRQAVEEPHSLDTLPS